MSSKAVLDRQRVGRKILSTARTHARDLGQRLNDALAPVLDPGETPPDLTRLAVLFARLVETRLRELVEVDRKSLAEGFDHAEPRSRRDRAAGEVHDHLQGLRTGFEVTFGRGTAAGWLGLTGRLPEDPLTLRLLGSRVLDRLRERIDEGPPEPSMPGVQLDLESSYEALRARVARLGRALDEVSHNEAEALGTQLLKHAALDAHDDALRGLVHLLRGLFHMAGDPERARGLRLTPPRPAAGTSKGA